MMKRKDTLLHCLDYDTEFKLTESSYKCKTHAIPDENTTEVLYQPSFIGKKACGTLWLALLFKVHQPGMQHAYGWEKRMGGCST